MNFGSGGPKNTPCLVCYTANGFLHAYSLPSLRPMLDMYFTSMKNPRVGRTMSFSNYGHGLYFQNPTEMQKFTLSAEFVRQLPEMKGQVYTADIPNPEPPKQVRPTAQFYLCLLFVKKVIDSGGKSRTLL